MKFVSCGHSAGGNLDDEDFKWKVNRCEKCEMKSVEKTFPDEINYQWPNLKWHEVVWHLVLLNFHIRHNSSHVPVAQFVYFDLQLNSYKAPFFNTHVTSLSESMPFLLLPLWFRTNNKKNSQPIQVKNKEKKEEKKLKETRKREKDSRWWASEFFSFFSIYNKKCLVICADSYNIQCSIHVSFMCFKETTTKCVRTSRPKDENWNPIIWAT